MYYLLSLLGGTLISVMVVFNGGLNERLGQVPSLVIIHLLGLVLVLILMALRREKPRLGRLPPLMYTAGLLGLFTTFCNNFAFGRISVSAMLALGLLGESGSSLLADHFGLMGLQKRPFRREKLWGGLLSLIGILLMWDGFSPFPVLLCLLAGVSVLVSRLINARQAQVNGLLPGTLLNYAVGLIGSLILLAFTGAGQGLGALPAVPPQYYLGGIIGVGILLISSTCVGKIPAFYMTLTLFVGQVLAGLLLDMALTGTFPMKNLIGGLFVLAGLTLNLMLDRRYDKKPAQL